jgi:hypothetical protein
VDFFFGDRSALDRVVNFSQAQALRQAVGYDFVGTCQNVDVKLLLVRRVGADRDHRYSRLQPFRPQQRFAAGRDRNDDIRAFHCGLHRLGHGKVARGNRAALAQIIGARPGLAVVAAPDADLVELSHTGQHFDLVARLAAGANYRDGSDFLARQMLGGDCACGCGAQIGDESVVQQKRCRGAGPGIEHDNHAVVGRQTKFWIARESGDDLHGVVQPAAHMSGLDVNLAAIFRNIQMNDRGQLGLPGRVGGESLLHGGNTNRRIEQFPNLGLA